MILQKIPSFLSGEITRYLYLKQSILSLFIGAITSLLAGVVLGYSNELLHQLPGLIILVPAALGMRGNIFATLASRLGSAFHMGTLTSFNLKNELLKANVLASFSTGILLSVYLGFVAKALTMLFGLPGMALSEFVSISLLAGIISGVLLIAISIWVSFFSYERHWDPDNITSPLITAAGDFFTIPSIIVSALAVSAFAHYADVIMYASLAISFAIIYFSLIANRAGPYYKILKESTPILLISGIFSAVAGLVLESFIVQIVAIPIILVFIPSFLETAGNLTNILSSRVSSKLHMGLIKPDMSFNPEKRWEITNSMRLSYVIYPFIGIFTYFAGSYLGITGLGLAEMAAVSIISGMAIQVVLIMLSMSVSIYSFRNNVDPDNVTIPIMTSVADIMSILVLVAVLQMLGLI